MIKEYFKYILPTIFTFTLAGFYSVIDGVFVGRAVGDAGLAGINVAFPLVALIMAMGTGIGMGGGVVSSIARGAADEKRSSSALGTTLIMLFVVSLPIMAFLNLASDSLCELLGAQGETLVQASAYISVIAWGVPFQIMVTGCIPLIRNRGNVGYAMGVQIFSGVINVILNYLFVVELLMGTSGAALATVISQAIAFVLVAVFFALASNRLPRQSFRVDLAVARHIAQLGMAPFGLTLLPEVTVVAMNINLSAYGGEMALATYAVIAYAAYGVQLVIQGVGDGSQPLISQYYGAGNIDYVRRLRNTNYVLAIGFGAFGLVLMYLLRFKMSELFGASFEVSEMVAVALPIFSSVYIFYGFTHSTTAYFYATDDARMSNIVVVCEAVLVVITVFCVAAFFGMAGIWWSITCMQVILSIIVAALLYLRHQQNA